MQFDFFDKKIKEAAENHHPAYDEKAWDKMERLLDKHLPQKKDDRRRIIFFILLFFVLLSGISYILIAKPWKNSEPLAGVNDKTEQGITTDTEKKSSSHQSETRSISDNTKQETEKNNDNSLSQINSNNPNSPEIREQKPDSKDKRPITFPLIAKNDPVERVEPSKSTTVSSDRKKNNDLVSVPVNNNNNQPSLANNEIDKKSATDNPVITKTEEKMAANSNVDANKEDQSASNNQTRKKNAAKNKKGGFFAFSLSAGPDVNKAGGSNISKANVSYGAGISFTLKKFTLRSGFYVAKKEYSAGPDDYKLDYVLPANIKLLTVNADCKVYEIPLSLTYNFASGKNSDWYAGLGVSSYLMKSEKYNNWYKNTTSGNTYPYNYQYNNKNRHYFSVLDISGGYSYRINKTFSLSAEPYIKIPLQGVGEGKVHLNSAGVLFSVGIRPFK